MRKITVNAGLGENRKFVINTRINTKGPMKVKEILDFAQQLSKYFCLKKSGPLNIRNLNEFKRMGIVKRNRKGTVFLPDTRGSSECGTKT